MIHVQSRFVITPATSAPPKSKPCSVTPPKPKKNSGGCQKSPLDQMITKMAATDLAETKKHALLKQHGYQIAVSVE